MQDNVATQTCLADELGNRTAAPCRRQSTINSPVPDTQSGAGPASGTSRTKPLIYLQDAHSALAVYL